jgi:hypothetical protein
MSFLFKKNKNKMVGDDFNLSSFRFFNCFIRSFDNKIARQGKLTG